MNEREELKLALEALDDLTAAYLCGFYDGKNKYAPRREWVGLTVGEIELCFYDANDAQIVAARSIEAKLREKNGG
jgi:hypothetical protein